LNRTYQLKFGYRGWRHRESINTISGFKTVIRLIIHFSKNERIICVISHPFVTVVILDLQKFNFDTSCVMWPRILSDHLHLLLMLRRSGTVALNIYFFMYLRGIHSENLTSKIYFIFEGRCTLNEELQLLVALILAMNHS
jgi:hypothetical protein